MNEMQLYENAQYSFGMSHPTNWIAQESDPNDQGIVVGFLAPGEDVNSPATYLFVQIEKLPSGKKITLEQYGQAVQKNLNAAMPDLKILTEGDISIGGQPGHAIVYNLASQDGTFRVLKAWTLRGERAYAFTYNSPDDRYDEFAGDISKMIGSMNFEPTQINNNYLPKSEVLDQTSMNDPLSEANWYNKGIALYDQGKYDEAIQAFDEAIEINPQNANAWSTKGAALCQQDKNDEAIQAFDEAIEINPQNADTWNNKGTALASLGKYDEAIQAFDEAIELDPKYAYAWYGKGNALVNLGKYDEAIKAYDKAIEINPRDARAWNNKGYALKMLGRTTASDLAYAMAKELG
jgi:tetratricopeptide (TPR) repeat protein